MSREGSKHDARRAEARRPIRPLRRALTAWLLAASALGPACGSAETAPAPASAVTAPSSSEIDLLRRVAERYRDIQSCDLRARVQYEIGAGASQQKLDVTFVLAAARPGRLHEEIRGAQQGSLRVSNGAQTWMYFETLGQYTREETAPPDPTAVDSAMIASGHAGLTGNLLYLYRRLGTGLRSARTLRQESLTVGEASKPCVVVEASYEHPSADTEEQPRLLWIDPERALVLKSQFVVRQKVGDQIVERKEVVTYSRVDLDTPVADSLFAFRPPPGATEVAQFSMPGAKEQNLSGRGATDFTLKDLAGKAHSLKGQRGKVVLLDFWATWCGPCRMQMPKVDMLSREFRNKGLVVFAINEGESVAAANAYLKKNRYTTMALLDGDQAVGRSYQVTGIPTLFVIDRRGTIVAHYVGVHTEESLRAALKKAGIQ